MQQSEGKASPTVQSDAEPRQVRGRWAEQLEPLVICANFSPSQMEEEEEEDFHPQSLESLLGEEEEEEEENVEEEEVSSAKILVLHCFILKPDQRSLRVMFRCRRIWVGTGAATSSTPQTTSPALTGELQPGDQAGHWLPVDRTGQNQCSCLLSGSLTFRVRRTGRSRCGALS